MNKKLIFCLLGKSAVGKDTMVDAVSKLNSKVEKLIPITTRPPRSFERDGVQYHFITREFFRKKIKSGVIMEHREYDVINKKGQNDKWTYAHEYPTSDISIMSGPVAMYQYIKDIPTLEVVPIYVTIPDDERLFRMVRRELRNTNHNIRETCRRYISDERDFSQEVLKDICNEKNTFNNINREHTAGAINKYINQYIDSFNKGGWY